MKKISVCGFVFSVMAIVLFGFTATVFAAPITVTESASPVTWDFAVLRGGCNPNGLATTAYFEYGPDLGYGSVSSTIDVGNGTTNINFPFTTLELIPETTYHYRFVAENADGITYGPNVVFTTSASPVNSPSMWFQPLDLGTDSRTAASQLDSTQPFDARAADDFSYSNPNGAIGQVRWWLTEWNGAPPYVTPSAFNIYIYTNDPSGSGCSPLDVIQSWTIPISESHEEFFDSATDTYSYWAELTPAFVPVPGVHYWVSIQAVLDFIPQAGLKSAAGPTNFCGAMYVFELAGIPNWTSLVSGSDIAFIFYPDIDFPIPLVTGTNGDEIVNSEPASTVKGTDFGTISFGASVTNVYSIANTGTANLAIVDVTINGTGASSFSMQNMPASVAAGADSDFSITFNPVSAGYYSANLSIVNNSNDTPYVINLAGMVEKADPIISTWPTATTITYGQTLADSSLSDGTASVAGSFGFTTPTTVPRAGTTNQDVNFFPTDSNNYNTISGTVSVTVNKKNLTVIGAKSDNKIYDGTTAATIMGGTLSGIELGDIITLGNAVDGNFASPDVGTDIAVGSLMTLDGTDAGNYSLTQPLLSADITTASQVISFANPGQQTITSTVQLVGTASSGFDVNFEVLSGHGVIILNNMLSFTNVGWVTIRATQPGDGNWDTAAYVDQSFQVTENGSIFPWPIFMPAVLGVK